MMWSNWNGMGVLGWTMMLVFWVVIVALVIWAIRSARPPTRTRTGSDALDILEGRFAAGEIDNEEFLERRRILDDSRKAGS